MTLPKEADVKVSGCTLHVYIEVTDLDRGAAFYGQALGLHERRRLDRGWTELTGASVPVFLVVPSGEPPDAPSAHHRTPVHLDFLTDNLEGSISVTTAAGASLRREIQSRRWGRMANMIDPFGNAFDLIELGPGGYDALVS